MKKLFATICLASASLLASAAPGVAQPAAIEHLEPPFWWAGMQARQLQLMVHGPRIADLEPALSYPGVRIAAVTRVANRNYLFIELDIADSAQAGKFEIAFRGAGRSARYEYRLLAREPGSAQRTGFNSSDAIYQIMPDRFANGDPANDSIAGMADRLARPLGHGRHGGDIQGVIDRLDYIAGMGFTQLWPTPLIENDMPAYSYHGYAATDHYKIDPRYGSNEDFRRLAREARRRGIGLIQDTVLSHIGTGHWWMKDLPMPDWVNHPGRFVATGHHRVSVQDPYAARADGDNFTRGWFGPNMPDMNQNNPLVANYLIQNNIWWIEYAGLSGLRIDTYSYSDGAFLAEYGRRILAEYPRLNMVGEEWHTQPAIVSRWQKGKRNFDGYTGTVPSMMDFPMAEAMRSALSTNLKHWRPLSVVYETLSLDYLYPDPGNLVLFEGNHDVSRIFSVVGQDVGLYKIALVYLMTMPRIPQFYYGTEIQMTSSVGERDDPSYRHDFPGGWAGDRVNAFTGAGLTARQREAQAFVKKLVNWRKGQPVIHHGKMMHYGAEDGTYVYFRYLGAKKVMVAFNVGQKEALLPTARFGEMLHGVASGVDVLTGQTHQLATELKLAPRSALVLEL
jgi:glycosidase